MLKTYSLNIDWLQLNCRLSRENGIVHSSKHYQVEPAGYSSNQWGLIQKVTQWQTNRPVAVIVSHPRSNAIDVNTILLKFENSFLYQGGLNYEVSKCLEELELNVKTVSRVDYSLDFQYFNNGLHPHDLIKRFVRNAYQKKGKGKFHLHGNHNTDIELETIRWGSRESLCCYYLYNKSKELREKKHKPYITEDWELNQLLNDKDVWRLEFSIKNGGGFKPDDDGFEYDDSVITFPSVVDRDVIPDLFKALVNKYFVFYNNPGEGDNTTRKTRLNEVALFRPFTPLLKYKRLTNKLESNRMDKIFLKKLEELNNEVRKGREAERLNNAIGEIKKHFGNSRALGAWAASKGIEV